MKRTEPKCVDLDESQLAEFLQRAETLLPTDMYELLKAIIDTYLQVIVLVARKNATIRRLRNLLFGARTEKTDAVLGTATDSASASASSGSDDSAASADSSDSSQDRPPRRNPFDYLTELELHANELAAKPEDWMPWNYRATLEAASTTAASPAPENPSPAGHTAEAPVRPP